MLNRCEFIGRVGREIESRTMGSGNPVVNVSLGVTEAWKDRQTGERKERTEWIRIVCFNEGLCKVFQNHVKKGDLIRVVGAMQARKWTDQSGVEKYTTEIVLQQYRGELTMLGGRQSDDDERPGKTEGGYTERTFGDNDDLDDSIPF